MKVYITGDTRGQPEPTLCALDCIHFQKELGQCNKGKKTAIPVGGGWGGTKPRKNCNLYEVAEYVSDALSKEAS